MTSTEWYFELDEWKDSAIANRSGRLNPLAIEPLHEIRDPEKLFRLQRSMCFDGWQGRPLLVMVYDRRLQALTGTHRLEAAILAGLDTIPVLLFNPLFDEELLEHACLMIDLEERLLEGNDYDRLECLEQFGFFEAAQLMCLETEP